MQTDRANGQKVGASEARFYPFGGYRTAPAEPLTGRGYTGHRHNDDLGLIYMNARYYVPGIGRFASADTIVPDPANPQSFNRYSYTRNNPLNRVDPSGHCDYSHAAIEYQKGQDCRDIVDYLIGKYDDFYFRSSYKSIMDIDWSYRSTAFQEKGGNSLVGYESLYNEVENKQILAQGENVYRIHVGNSQHQQSAFVIHEGEAAPELEGFKQYANTYATAQTSLPLKKAQMWGETANMVGASIITFLATLEPSQLGKVYTAVAFMETINSGSNAVSAALEVSDLSNTVEQSYTNARAVFSHLRMNRNTIHYHWVPK